MNIKMENNKPTLSACLIVKNEEKLIEQCLDSIKDVVDEIIIVDTGSTDNTIEIAKKWTGKIYFHEWQNSFSEARNYSISYATGDWILIIDADEKLEKDDVPVLRKVLKRSEFNSIFFSVLSYLPSGISKNYSQRIFRRGKGHYDGIVHNQLVCEGQSLATDIRIYHYGYNLDPEKMLKKFKRTEALLKNQVMENPTFGFAWMNLTRIYKCQELWDEAIKTAEEALNTRREFLDAITYQMIMYDMAYSLFSKGEYDKAEKACRDILSLYPDNLDINFILGSISICKKDYQAAIRNYKKYLQISEGEQKQPEFTSLIVDTYASQGQAWNNIGSAHAELGQFDLAIDSYLKAISYKKDPIHYENLARIYLKQNRIDDAAMIIREADKLGMATDIMLSQLAEISYADGNINEAIDYIRKAIEKNNSELKHRMNLGRLLIVQGNLNEAEGIFENAMPSNPERPEILHNLAMINIKLLNRNRSLEYVNKIMALDGITSNQYMAMGNDWVNMKEYEFAMPFYEKCLQNDPKNSSALVNLATCYAELGRYESAIVGYRSALLANPKDPTIIRNLLTMKKKMESQITYF
jgi:tetratricopeptide (TPR) repeat protein